MKEVAKTKIKIICDAFKNNNVLVYPTESSYALGCVIDAKKAVKKIYELKKRPKHMSFIVLAKDINMVKKYVILDKKSTYLFNALSKNYPLTLILKTKKKRACFQDTIAIRISNHFFIKKLFTCLDAPIISTSLNFHKKPAIYSKTSFIKQFKNELSNIDYFVNAQTLTYRRPSMIIDMTLKDAKIIREHTKEMTKMYHKLMSSYK